MRYLLYLFATILATIVVITVFAWVFSQLLTLMNQPDTLIVIVAFIFTILSTIVVVLMVFYIWYWYFKLVYKPKI